MPYVNIKVTREDVTANQKEALISGVPVEQYRRSVAS